ncbi:hypothetical protein T01_3089 [Trichinella spiralis]|uniref:Uncharacterized protein n=1 Tax=Trichinella spiralis TaxID=6334 RepID=A0A0V1BJQ4_TRISP|nr:hypothetical protein T01_3089 [Trichinella spiralis]
MVVWLSFNFDSAPLRILEANLFLAALIEAAAKDKFLQLQHPTVSVLRIFLVFLDVTLNSFQCGAVIAAAAAAAAAATAAVVAVVVLHDSIAGYLQITIYDIVEIGGTVIVILLQLNACCLSYYNKVKLVIDLSSWIRFVSEWWHSIILRRRRQCINILSNTLGNYLEHFLKKSVGFSRGLAGNMNATNCHTFLMNITNYNKNIGNWFSAFFTRHSETEKVAKCVVLCVRLVFAQIGANAERGAQTRMPFSSTFAYLRSEQSFKFS